MDEVNETKGKEKYVWRKDGWMGGVIGEMVGDGQPKRCGRKENR